MAYLKDPFTTFFQELGEKVLPVGIYSESGKPVRVVMTQGQPLLGHKLTDWTELAYALGLDVSDLGSDGLEAQAVSTGATHLLVPVQTLASLARIRVDTEALRKLARPLDCQGCYDLYLNVDKSRSVARARAFFPGIGISEDPATGSAAGPLAAYLVSRNLIAEGIWIVIEQGFEMDRPSQIEVRVQGNQIEVAGRSVIVAEGTISV